MTSHIKAPPARLVNAFDGKKAPKKYFEALSEADDKVGELECLREENAQLQCRVDETRRHREHAARREGRPASQGNRRPSRAMDGQHPEYVVSA